MQTHDVLLHIDDYTVTSRKFRARWALIGRAEMFLENWEYLHGAQKERRRLLIWCRYWGLRNISETHSSLHLLVYRMSIFFILTEGGLDFRIEFSGIKGELTSQRCTWWRGIPLSFVSKLSHCVCVCVCKRYVRIVIVSITSKTCYSTLITVLIGCLGSVSIIRKPRPHRMPLQCTVLSS